MTRHTIWAWQGMAGRAGRSKAWDELFFVCLFWYAMGPSAYRLERLATEARPSNYHCPPQKVAVSFVMFACFCFVIQ
jgi:hypothetical protein